MSRVVAFIPARCGSKSIPFKNIKPLGGRPLIYWNLEALEACPEVDEIVVATDCKEIIAVVEGFAFQKVSVYQRSAENAQDTSSTESVMLEYLEQSNLDGDVTFMLVQITSPLTRAIDFSLALQALQTSGADSLLTCVRIKRFFWSDQGEAQNYDFRNRPRRQDFAGQLMENGAFYINTVENIRRDNNRLSGRIIIHELPEYMATEIDEPHDWQLMEHLIMEHRVDQEERVSRIKLIVSDVDGVLTDAGMYYSEKGDELKKFNTHDGKAFQLMREGGIKTAIITSENTQLVERRAKKLKIDFLYQGKEHGGKLDAIREICSKLEIDLEEVAYIGDDINCKEALENVGLAACPANALAVIKAIPGIIVLERKGGEGAVREFYQKFISTI